MNVVPRHFEEDFEFPEHCDHCPKEFAAGVEYQRVQFVVDADRSVVGTARAVMVEHSFELVLCLGCAGRLNHWMQTPLSEVPADGEVVDELDDVALAEELEKELFILGDGETPPSLASFDRVLEHRPLHHPERHCQLHRERDPICYACYLSAQEAPCTDRHCPVHTPSAVRRDHTGSCACPVCAPCKHHPQGDCSCYCRFGTCGPRTCPPEFLPAKSNIEGAGLLCLDPHCPAHGTRTPGPCTHNPQIVRLDEATLVWGERRTPTPCLDPEKMLGFCDQFGGTDDPEG